MSTGRPPPRPPPPILRKRQRIDMPSTSSSSAAPANDVEFGELNTLVEDLPGPSGHHHNFEQHHRSMPMQDLEHQPLNHLASHGHMQYQQHYSRPGGRMAPGSHQSAQVVQGHQTIGQMRYHPYRTDAHDVHQSSSREPEQPEEDSFYDEVPREHHQNSVQSVQEESNVYETSFSQQGPMATSSTATTGPYEQHSQDDSTDHESTPAPTANGHRTSYDPPQPTTQPTAGGQYYVHDRTYLDISNVVFYDVDQQIEDFWLKQRKKIESLTDSYLQEATRNQILPLARIKKIMKIDERVSQQMISADAPLVLSQACEMLIQEMTVKSWRFTEEGRRRTLQRNDIAITASRNDHFDFLVDIIPREGPRYRVPGNHVVAQTAQLVDTPSDQYYLPENSHVIHQQMHEARSGGDPSQSRLLPVQYTIQMHDDTGGRGHPRVHNQQQGGHHQPAQQFVAVDPGNGGPMQIQVPSGYDVNAPITFVDQHGNLQPATIVEPMDQNAYMVEMAQPPAANGAGDGAVLIRLENGQVMQATQIGQPIQLGGSDNTMPIQLMIPQGYTVHRG